jgi:KDO2-lipid IV(A) lauroyltransferase
LKNNLIYYTAVVLIKLFNALPRHWALTIGGIIGEIWYILVAKDRKVATKQMREVLGYTGGKLKAHVRANYEAMVKNLIDVLRMSAWTSEYVGSLVMVEGYENFLQAYNRNQGVLALTGHIGNFELLAGWFSYYKKHKVSVIGRELYDKRFDKLLIDQRAKYGEANIPTTSSIKTIIKALRDGHAIGVLTDQDSTRVSGYFIDFFGKKALTPAGPMFIARKTGAPVVPMAIYRQPDDTYIIRILPELKLEWTDNKEEDIKNALVQCNRALEQLIMYDPLQWVWVHNRWRTRPPDEKEAAA